jgi:hypothetical protein
MAKKPNRGQKAPVRRKPVTQPEVMPTEAAPVNDFEHIQIPSARTIQPRSKFNQPLVPAKSTADFKQEYFYVYSDLKRVGILAASLLFGLIILSFIIG